jgi:hypothetical protein
MYNLGDVKKSIKSKPRCFIYKVAPDNNFKLIGKTDGKNEAKELIKSNYNDDKYFFIVAKIVFHTSTKFGQKGPVSVNFDIYAFINNKLSNLRDTTNKKFINIRDNMVGPVWFDKKYLESKGWNKKYIEIIIKKLVSGEKGIVPMNVFHINFL